MLGVDADYVAGVVKGEGAVDIGVGLGESHEGSGQLRGGRGEVFGANTVGEE